MGRKSLMEIKIGDRVVYPGYGIGEVSKIEKREIQGIKQTVFVVTFSDFENVSTVMIPEASLKDIGIRKPSSPKIVKRALDFIKDGIPDDFPSWKDRFFAHTNMVNNGDLMSIAQVLKSLHIQNKKKPLSFREKKLYQKCLLLLCSEVSYVKKKERTVIEGNILSLLDGK